MKYFVKNSAKLNTGSDLTAGMESSMRELTEEETKAASGGNPIAVAAFVFLTGVKVGQFVHNNKSSGRGGGKVNAGGFGSDSRIKEDIAKVGFDPANGVDIYSWKYKSEDQTRYVGVMAQEILGREDLASAVGVATDGPFEGYLAVDYAMLGLKMTTEQQWNESGLESLRAA